MAARAKRPDASGWISLGGSSRQYRNIHTGEVLSRRAYREQHQLGGQRIESVVASRDWKSVDLINTPKTFEKQIAQRNQLNNEIAYGNQVAIKRKSPVKISKERLAGERKKNTTVYVHLRDKEGVLHRMALTHSMASAMSAYNKALVQKDKGRLRVFSEMTITDIETGKIITLPRYDQRFRKLLGGAGFKIEEYKKPGKD